MPPLTYPDAVEVESMDVIQQALDAFFLDFDPAKPTIVLLPGGLGSTLKQNFWPFFGFPQPVTAFRSVIWVDLGLLFGDALRLPIDADGFDTGHRIVVAKGDLDYCLIHPYNDAVKFFREMLEANVLVFGWDWRRAVPKAVELLDRTLSEMAARSLNMTGQNVLLDTYLVGHSMGGMVAKLLMTHKPQQLTDPAELAGMISVGTPFYGYFGQLDRFYNGDSLFNDLYGAPTVADITSSWPGMYSLLPIDETTYDQSHVALGLTAYPVTDAQSGAPVDPYSPGTVSRYPSWVRVNQIPRGLDVRQELAAALPAGVGDKVHHLRVDAPGTTLSSTVWQSTLPFGYTPGASPSPVSFQNGAGDDTIPVWSAALASTPPANIHDFPEGSHAFLMEERKILKKIGEIITGQAIEERRIDERLGPRIAIAEREEVDALMEAINSGKITKRSGYGRKREPLIRPEVLRRLMQEYGL